MGIRHVRGRLFRREAVRHGRHRADPRRVGPVVDVDDPVLRHHVPRDLQLVDARPRREARGGGTQEGDAQDGGEGEVGQGDRDCALGGARGGASAWGCATAACAARAVTERAAAERGGRPPARELALGSCGDFGGAGRS